MAWLVPALCLGLSPLAAAADDSTPWWRVWDAFNQSASPTSRLFTQRETRVLRDFLRGLGTEDRYGDDRPGNKPKKHKQLPPGLQKKLARGGSLPPGWQKKVARGEVLDADLYARSSALPPGVARQLQRHQGTSVRRVEDRVVRILDATGQILDVIQGR